MKEAVEAVTTPMPDYSSYPEEVRYAMIIKTADIAGDKALQRRKSRSNRHDGTI